MKNLSSLPNLSNRSTRRPFARLTDNRLRLTVILAALGVAALAVILHVESPTVWTFLGLVITTLLGQASREA